MRNFLAVLQQVLISIRQPRLGAALLALVTNHSCKMSLPHHVRTSAGGKVQVHPCSRYAPTPRQSFSLELHINPTAQSNFCFLTSIGFNFYFSSLNVLKPSLYLLFFSKPVFYLFIDPPVLFIQLHPFSSFILSSKPDHSGLLSHRTSLPAYPSSHALNPSKVQSIFLGADKDRKEDIRQVSPGTRTAMLPFLRLDQNYPSHCVLMPHLSSPPGCQVSAGQPVHTSPPTHKQFPNT